jgi:phosphate transport system substrate-binding protein
MKESLTLSKYLLKNAAIWTAVVFVSVITPLSVCAQLKPELDAKIPFYQPLTPIKGQLKISGSESMKPLLSALVDELKRRHNGIKFTLTGDGSQTGLTDLLEHRTEVAAMSRRMTSSEIAEFVKEYGYEPAEVPVATDALAVFVQQTNPVTGLSLDELDSVFCVERRRGLNYPVASWGLLGLTDEWFDASIRPYGRNGKSGTSHFFREEVCKGGTFVSHMVGGHGPASVVMDVAKDPQGIGFSGLGYQTSMVKAVPIAAVKGGRYVEPSSQSVMDGSYPLRRSIYLYVARAPKSEADPCVRELVRFVLSAQGQQIALDQGYFPLPLTEIARLLSKWSPSVKSAAMEGQPKLRD